MAKSAMMSKQQGYFISTDSTGSTMVLLGAGVSTLDENPSPNVGTTAYIIDKSESKSIDGYSNTFPFTSHLLIENGAMEEAIDSLYTAYYEQQTGGDAERDLVIVDLYKTPEAEKPNEFPARKFRVAVEVSGVTGAAVTKKEMSGNLNGVGDALYGTFDTTTKTFTENV